MLDLTALTDSTICSPHAGSNHTDLQSATNSHPLSFCCRLVSKKQTRRDTPKHSLRKKTTVWTKGTLKENRCRWKSCSGADEHVRIVDCVIHDATPKEETLILSSEVQMHRSLNAMAPGWSNQRKQHSVCACWFQNPAAWRTAHRGEARWRCS